MSYSRSYTEYVHYSGSVSYHYGPSEHGGSGTAYYSGEVPVTVNLYVDTLPFDRSVDSCNHSVRGLNGAVIAMNASQVASINSSANKISNHVIGGFFNMVKSELSQNMASMFAKFKSIYHLLITKSDTLSKQQLVMQDDYSRVSERYNKIFTNLDEELEKRVVALDKNVYEISKKIQGEQLHNDTAQKVAAFLIGTNEEEIVKQQLTIANTKAKVTSAISGLAYNQIQEAVYSKKVKSIVSDKNCNIGDKNYIPVIYTESKNLTSDIVDYNCYSNLENSNYKEQISESVKNYFISNSNIENTQDEIKQIDDAFTLIAEKSFLDLQDEKSVRVFNEIKRLKEN